MSRIFKLSHPAFAGIVAVVTEGQYRKVTTKVGTAFLTVQETEIAESPLSLSYTNRRGEVTENLTVKEFLTVWKTGINTKVSDSTGITVSGGEGSIELIEEEAAQAV